MRKLVSFVLASIFVCSAFVDSADAAKKKKPKKPAPKGQIVAVTDVFSVNATIKISKKKNKNVTITCRDTTPGDIKQTAAGLLFTPYSLTIKKLKKRNPKSPKIAYFKKLQALKNKCVRPAFLSLDRYDGPFGAAEAQHLFDRASYGASPARIQEAVADGLERTVMKLTTYVQEDYAVSAGASELEPDGYWANHPQNEIPDPLNPNDGLSIDGAELAFYYRVLNTPNAFFLRLQQWIMDERASANARVLNGNEMWAFKEYEMALRRAAQTGDFKQYIRDMSLNYLLAGRYLDLFTYESEYVPFSRTNENWARELLELVSVGPFGLDGNENYNTTDIVRISEVLTGYLINCRWEFDEYNVCRVSFTSSYRPPGPWTIFEGKPAQAVVSTPEDVVDAILRNPALADNLAKELYEGFINPFATPSALRELSEKIVNKNFNLVEVLRDIFMSRAFYETRSRKSLIKDPLEFALGFIRQIGISVDLENLSNNLFQMRQNAYDAPSVFGWSEILLASQARVMSQRNFIDDIIDISDGAAATIGFNIYDRFLTGFTYGPDETKRFVRKLIEEFNAPLTEAQIDILANMLNSRLNSQGQEVNEVFDMRPGAARRREKLEDAILAVTTLDMYRMK